MGSVRVTTKEVDLSFDRFLIDAEDDFFPDPLKYKDLRGVRSELVEQVRRDLSRALQAKKVTYNVLPFCDWDVPKANYLVRHAVCLHPIDRMVYSYILLRLARRIEPQLSNSRYSYRMSEVDSRWPFKIRPVWQWIQFKNNLKAYVQKSTAHEWIVSTDIAGFYEYMHLTDFKKQMYNLCRAKDDPLIELLNTFLRSCAPSDYSGIPQNYDPSSYLASAFLDFLDKELEATGIKHFRYVDDIKVVCRSKKDAKQAIVKLIHSLRRFNLNLATHKTEIWNRNEPKFLKFVQDFPPILKRTDFAVSKKVQRQVNQCLNQLVVDLKQMIRRTANPLDERLFRAYIWRVVKCCRFAGVIKPDLRSTTKACLSLLTDTPDRTDSLVRFLVLWKDRKQVQTEVHNVIESTIYPWQAMHLWLLMTQADSIKVEKLLSAARVRIQDSSYPEPARSYAVVFLGKHGNYQDRNRISELLKLPQSFFQRRCTLIALQEHPDKMSIYRKQIRTTDDLVIIGLIRHLMQEERITYPTVVENLGDDQFIS